MMSHISLPSSDIFTRILWLLGYRPTWQVIHGAVGRNTRVEINPPSAIRCPCFTVCPLPNSASHGDRHAVRFEDIDVLIGMDVIVFGDFLITNADGKTTFQFRTPSEGGVEL